MNNYYIAIDNSEFASKGDILKQIIDSNESVDGMVKVINTYSYIYKEVLFNIKDLEKLPKFTPYLNCKLFLSFKNEDLVFMYEYEEVNFLSFIIKLRNNKIINSEDFYYFRIKENNKSYGNFYFNSSLFLLKNSNKELSKELIFLLYLFKSDQLSIIDNEEFFNFYLEYSLNDIIDDFELIVKIPKNFKIYEKVYHIVKSDEYGLF